MTETGLETFFEAFLKKDSVFFDKKVIQSNYTPETILHREEQTKQIANILAPALKHEKPSNAFIYGKTGTGKTLTVRHTTKKLMDVAEKEEVPLKIIFLRLYLFKTLYVTPTIIPFLLYKNHFRNSIYK